ncbi:glycosyltransferase [Jannaschia sp. LMIT008]|uniref:glycosyltransferase n=1 Tax=Jannaschia maritima TaxID=3032585 RepID=UPI002811F03F|nr:glycosyltransferase [Jannaschia sp. LMIT008]
MQNDSRPDAASVRRGGLRIALVGNHPPRRCGIATFTRDVAAALRGAGHRVHVTAMVEPGATHRFGGAVDRTVDQGDRASHAGAGAAMAAWGPDVVLVEHEFGIYGGPAGAWLLDLLDAARTPAVVRLHTVLDAPDPAQARVMTGLAARAGAFVVMARHGRDILCNARPDGPEVHVVPHGVPDRPLVPARDMRARLGWLERPTIMTFGLLSPGKGIEMVIDALPAIRDRVPAVRYVLVGATHPALVATEGERYRDALRARARAGGVQDALEMVDRYVADDELCDLLQAADLYVTPYANPAQITSGTLAYALACGVPTLSTPYWHAREVLAPECLVPFGAPDVLANAAASLLGDDRRRQALSERLWHAHRGATWPRHARALERTLRRVARRDAVPDLHAAE